MAEGKLQSLGDDKYAFWCPGCKCGHWFLHHRMAWIWNKSFDSPTVTPSLLTTYNGLNADSPGHPPSRCHLFLTNGKIHFLDDCSHDLKGQTVALENF